MMKLIQCFGLFFSIIMVLVHHHYNAAVLDPITCRFVVNNMLEDGCEHDLMKIQRASAAELRKRYAS